MPLTRILMREAWSYSFHNAVRIFREHVEIILSRRHANWTAKEKNIFRGGLLSV
jgi:hypothetical protein